MRKIITCYFEKSATEKIDDALKKIDDNLIKMKERNDIESKFVRESLIVLASKDIVLSKRMEKLHLI